MNGAATTWLRGAGPSAVPRFVWLQLLVDAGLGIVYLGDHVIGQPVSPLSDLFDLNREANLPTWWSSVQWFAAAALMFAVADARVSRSERRSWALWLLPLLLLAFSVDETIQLHEYVGVQTDVLLPGGERAGTALRETGLFFLVEGVPAAILIGGLLAVARPYLHPPEGAFRMVVAGVVLLFIGAVGVDFLANFVEPESTPAVVLIYIEESLEMLAGTVIVWAGYTLRSTRVGPNRERS